MYFGKVTDFKKEAIAYSLRHQILSEYTAFVCVGKQLMDRQFQEFQSKGAY
jgi:hypothetical protein